MEDLLSLGRTKGGHSIHLDTECTLDLKVWDDFDAFVPAIVLDTPGSTSEMVGKNRIFGSEADIDAVASARYFSNNTSGSQQTTFKYGTRGDVSSQELSRSRRQKLGNSPTTDAINRRVDKVHPDGVICLIGQYSARCVVENKDWWRHSLETMWKERKYVNLFKLFVGQYPTPLLVRDYAETLMFIRAGGAPNDEIQHKIRHTQHAPRNDVCAALRRNGTETLPEMLQSIFWAAPNRSCFSRLL